MEVGDGGGDDFVDKGLVVVDEFLHTVRLLRLTAQGTQQEQGEAQEEGLLHS